MKLILATFSLALAASASAKGVDGGGGALIQSAFLRNAYSQITRIEHNPAAQNLCSAADLEKGLQNSQIDLVNELTDPKTGNGIQNLDAWTVPGQIQLLKKTWQNMVGVHTSPFIAKQDIDILVLHEVMRSTGTCDDDGFKLSIPVHRYLQGAGATKFSEKWVFKYAYRISDTDSPGVVYSVDPDLGLVAGAVLICTSPITDSSRNTCYDGTYVYKNYKWSGYHTEPPLATSSPSSLEEVSVDVPDLDNTLTLVSPEHPFVLIHDIQHGLWTGQLQ